jgi:beta-glucosidase-like glycosyl hydrolase
VALVAVALLILGILPVSRAATCPWVGSSDPLEAKVSAVVDQMTTAEKFHMVHGSLTDPAGIVGPVYAGLIPAIPRLCIPQLGFLDGPVGVGDGLTGATQLPAPVLLASTWDEAAATAFGDVLGAEVDGKGANVALSPALDIVRDPRAGRSFEGFGEDPHLTSRLGVAQTKAIQARGIIAQPKHYAVYNQETLRDTAADDAVVDERTMHEIYLPPFEAVVTEGGAGSIMCSYSYVNGVHACGHPYLLTQVLKGQWGFDGFVTADWYATPASAGAANAGLDMQMPDDCYFGPALEEALVENRFAEARLDDMVSRILRSTFEAGLFERVQTGLPSDVVTTAAHATVARSVAAQGMVLLRNEEDVLPLDASWTGTIAIIGAAAKERAITGGGGSSAVLPVPGSVVTPYAGIDEATTATLTYDDGANPVSSALTAQAADVALVFVALKQGEFKDRLTLELFPTDTALIESVTLANPNTVVVLNTGSAVTMPWLHKVAGVLQAWYPGQEYGHAVADVLFGAVNPSGKLPMTFPKQLTQMPTVSPLRWPGVAGSQYSEALAVGYRWYDEKEITPLFPFGFGLSYTRFMVSNLAVTPTVTADSFVSVEADVSNIGSRSGSEIVQLYLSHPAGSGEPPKTLRGFRRVMLEAGQTVRVRFDLGARDLATWDASPLAHRWKAAPGIYGVRVGTSSRDLPLSGTFRLTNTLTPGVATLSAPELPPVSPVDAISDGVMCPKDVIAPFVNGALSLTGFPPLEVLGRPVP